MPSRGVQAGREPLQVRHVAFSQVPPQGLELLRAFAGELRVRMLVVVDGPEAGVREGKGGGPRLYLLRRRQFGEPESLGLRTILHCLPDVARYRGPVSVPGDDHHLL